MAGELARLIDIRQRRVMRAQEACHGARTAEQQAQTQLAKARQAHKEYRENLPVLLHTTFTPVVGQQIDMSQLSGARQKEAELYAQLDELHAACAAAQDSLKQAQENTREAQKVLQRALRKQEALRLLEDEAAAAMRVADARAADAVIDEFAEQSFWQNR